MSKAKAGEPSRIYSISVSQYCKKSRDFYMACVFFSTSSGTRGKPDIVKVLHKTRVGISWKAIWPFRAQTILRVPDRTIA